MGCTRSRRHGVLYSTLLRYTLLYYDGLCQVETAWLAPGLEGFKVWKFALKRLPGQPPLAVEEAPPTSPTSPAQRSGGPEPPRFAYAEGTLVEALRGAAG